MASQVYWRNGVTGGWFFPGNWVSGAVPVTGDTAIIETGTATIDAPANPLVGIAIVLGEGDAILRAIHATFEGTNPPQGTPEINATLTVTGDLAASTDATFIVEGQTSFDGQIFVEAIAGSLTILIQDGPNGQAGVFALKSTDNKAAVVVSQESFLDFEGQTVTNGAFIQIEGTAEISDGVTFTGPPPSQAGATGGVFLLENGGRLIVEGSIDHSQAVIFIDGTGELVIENVADFDAVIEYAELPTPAGQPHQGVAGGRIHLTDVQAQSFVYAAGQGTNPGTLKLYAGANPVGTPVAELDMRLVSEALTWSKTALTSADFVLSSDGSGGSVITYNPGGSTYLMETMPSPVIASAGDVVKLSQILKDSFGKNDVPFKGVWLFPSAPFDNSATNVGYWETPNVTPQWYIGGKAVEAATFVKDISKVTLHVGNQIDSPASFQIRTTKDQSGPDATFITYDVWTVDPRVMQVAGVAPGSLPTPDIIVKAAEAFASVYGDGVIPNTNLCNWIADNVAAAAGAPMPAMNFSLDPSLNQEGGFWRIVYASDIPDPVSDWSGLVEEGDIVRMGWFKPESGRISGHTTTVLSAVDSNGQIRVYDNNDQKHIGTHDAAYWVATDPDDITIYRLDPNQQYLIQGTDVAETIRGSIYDNLIRPGGGADLIDAKLGDNEIEGTAAQLSGIWVKHFNSGDSFHFTDLDPDDTTVLYQKGKLRVFEDSQQVAVIDVPKPGKGLSFVVTTDADGGATVEIGAPDIAVSGNNTVIRNKDKTPSAADGTSFGTVSVGDTVIHTFTVSNDGLAALTISKLKLPKGFVLVEKLSSTIAAGASDSFQIQLNTNKAGSKAGKVEIKTNDIDQGEFIFAVSGVVTRDSSSFVSTTKLLDMHHVMADMLSDMQPGHWHDFDLL
jgi:hypothetical protein